MNDLEKQNIILRFRKNQLFPTLDLVASAALSGLETNFSSSIAQIRDADNPRWAGGVVFSIPLTFRAERNNYKAAHAAKSQALFRLKKLEQDILVQINNAVELAQRN